MIRFAALALALAVSSTAAAQAPAPAAAPAYTVASPIGSLLDNPDAKAVLTKNIPQIVANPQFEQARTMTLGDIVQFVPDVLTPEMMAKINADLATVVKK
jgi:hypothetical protein